MSEKQTSPLKGRYDDEIDLFELLQKLWAQRLIIIFVTLCGVVSAAGYVYFAPKKFESTTVLAPPSITTFAPFVRDVQVGSGSTVDLLEAALKLSDNVMKLLGRRLLSPATQAAFISENPNFVGCTARNGQNGNKSSEITVSFACADEESSLLALDSYIEYASKIAAQDFQSLMKSVDIERTIQANELYSIESPPSTKITPRKSITIALGLVLGGMLGLFTALIIILTSKSKAPSRVANAG